MADRERTEAAVGHAGREVDDQGRDHYRLWLSLIIIPTIRKALILLDRVVSIIGFIRRITFGNTLQQYPRAHNATVIDK